MSVTFGLHNDLRRWADRIDLISKAVPFKRGAVMNLVVRGVTAIAAAPMPLGRVKERFAISTVVRPASHPGAKLVPNTASVPSNHFTMKTTRATYHVFLFDRIEFGFSLHVEAPTEFYAQFGPLCRPSQNVLLLAPVLHYGLYFSVS